MIDNYYAFEACVIISFTAPKALNCKKGNFAFGQGQRLDMSEINYRTAITPNDADVIGSCDSESVQNAVDTASRLGINKVVIPKYNMRSDSVEWVITETIKIPSHMNIVLDNCYMRLADGVYCNMFTNSLAFTPEGNTLCGEQEDISICGIGTAVLDGGNHNGLCEKTSMKEGRPSIQRNNTIYLHNVRDIKISDITIKNQRWWGLCFMYCRYASVRNIITRAEMVCPQQDAVDLRMGCNNFIIENITGKSGDDTLAMTTVNRNSQMVVGKDSDIHDIIARNIKSDANNCCIVRFLNHDFNKIYNVLLDGVIDVSAPYSGVRPACAVRIGEKGRYVHYRHNQMGETKNITVRNVYSRARHAVCINSTLMNSTISNVHVFGDGLNAIGTFKGVDLKNVYIDGVFYNPDQRTDSGAEELPPEEYRGCAFKLNDSTSENFSVRNVFVDKAEHVALLTGGIKMDISGLHYSNIGKEVVAKDEASEMIVH